MGAGRLRLHAAVRGVYHDPGTACRSPLWPARLASMTRSCGGSSTTGSRRRANAPTSRASPGGHRRNSLPTRPQLCHPVRRPRSQRACCSLPTAGMPTRSPPSPTIWRPMAATRPRQRGLHRHEPRLHQGHRRQPAEGRITFDKFHAVKLVNDAVDQVRREEQQRRPELKRTAMSGSRTPPTSRSASATASKPYRRTSRPRGPSGSASPSRSSTSSRPPVRGGVPQAMVLLGHP